MADQIYKVQDPSGNVREISGPVGATDAEILAQAQKLFAPEKGNRYVEAAKGGAEYGLAGPAMLWEGVKHLDEKQRELGYNLGGSTTDALMKLGQEYPSLSIKPEEAALYGSGVNALSQTGPMLAGGEVAKLAAPLMRGAGRTLQRWAMKPDPSIGARRAGNAVDVSLQEGISATEGGAAKLAQRMRELNAEGEALLRANAQIPNAGVPIGPATSAADRLAAQLRQGTGTAAQRNARIVERERDALINHPSAQGGNIPLLDAQAAKQANYRQMGDAAYKEGRRPMTERDALSAMTRELRGGIENLAPEVAPINARLSAMVDALKSISPQAFRNSNQPMSSLSPLIASHNPALGAGYEAARHAGLRSALARMLYGGAEQIPANAARAAIGSQTIGDEQ